MTKFKGLFLLLCLSGMLIAGCSKDDQSPVIVNFKVDNTVTTAASGPHNLGDTVQFDFEATDDTELGEYMVKNESAGSTLIANGALSGQLAMVSFSFDIDAADWNAGDDITLSFIVEDDRGSSTIRTYTIDVQ